MELIKKINNESELYIDILVEEDKKILNYLLILKPLIIL